MTVGNGVHWGYMTCSSTTYCARAYSAGATARCVSYQYLFDHARTLVSDLCLEWQTIEVCGEQGEHKHSIVRTDRQASDRLRGAQFRRHRYEEH